MNITTELETYLDAVLGEAEGYLHTAIGIGPYFDDHGKYKHKHWSQRHYLWPEQRRQALGDLLAAAEESDAYLCPYLMMADKRAQGAAAARRIVHADIDGGRLDPELVARLDGFAVASGSPGNGHVYVALAESVPAHWHKELCRGLGAYLGAVDAKISDNDVLRPPGTLNRKPAAAGIGEPAPVEWLVRPTGKTWDPEALAAVLGVNLPEQANAAPAQRNSDPPGPAEPVNLEVVPSVAAALVVNSGDRSADTMRVVGACYDAGLTEAQARWAVGTRKDLADRLADRRDDDVQTCYRKAAESRHARVTEVPVITDTAPTTVHRGQARIAYRLADHYREKLLHVTGLGWFIWDGKRWVADERGGAKRAVLSELRRSLSESLGDKDLRSDVRKCESASGVAGVLDLAAALEPLAAAVADIDADPYLINVANGTLDLHTMELRPHRPADRITKVCRGAYNPGATSELWQAFLAEVLPDPEVRRFVQRLVGVGLLGAVREHVLGIWTGTGANGKSVLDKGIRYTLGDYAATAEPDLFMHREGAHPTGEMDLRGVRWIVVSESDKDRRLAEATMKRLTGGDTIRARRMRQDFVEFTPSHTPTLITNHLPKVSGDDPAIWRRIRVVPFDVVIPEDKQDRDLDTKLQLQADAILTWAVEGWKDYLDRGLAEPAGVKQATDTYHHNSDAVARFIEERCHVSPAVKATTTQLFDAWDRWRGVDGTEAMSRKAFGMALTAKGYPASQPVNGKKWRQGLSVRAEDTSTDDDEGDEYPQVNTQTAPIAPISRFTYAHAHDPDIPEKGAMGADPAPEDPWELAEDIVVCKYCGEELPAHLPSRRARGYCHKPACLAAHAGERP